MNGSGSKSCSPVPVFSGEGYRSWSAKMKQRLISGGVWVCVEEEEEEETTEAASDAAKLALSLIHHSLSPTILKKISHANTPKQAWDTLHSLFDRNTSNSHQSNSKVSVEESLDPAELEKWAQPLSGDKPFFDMVLTKSSVRPLCHMNFPMTFNSLFPSTNLVADVRFCGSVHKIHFYGQRKQKTLGAGWRQLVDEYNMLEGDFVVFEVLESSDSMLKMNMQLLKPAIPPQLKRLFNMREFGSNSIIQIDDDTETD